MNPLLVLLFSLLLPAQLSVPTHTAAVATNAPVRYVIDAGEPPGTAGDAVGTTTVSANLLYIYACVGQGGFNGGTIVTVSSSTNPTSGGWASNFGNQSLNVVNVATGYWSASQSVTFTCRGNSGSYWYHLWLFSCPSCALTGDQFFNAGATSTTSVSSSVTAGAANITVMCVNGGSIASVTFAGIAGTNAAPGSPCYYHQFAAGYTSQSMTYNSSTSSTLSLSGAVLD